MASWSMIEALPKCRSSIAPPFEDAGVDLELVEFTRLGEAFVAARVGRELSAKGCSR
jgi:hypothetical protein